MKASDVFLVIVVGVVTTIIGNILWRRMERNNTATILPFPKPADCGCGCKGA